MSSIFLRKSGGQWTSPSDSGYPSESDLVKLISEYPQILPGVSKGSYVTKEFPTNSGPIDLLIINANDGSITIVECKLARNPQSRREIIGQILDYAASLRNYDFDEFHNKWIGRGGADLKRITDQEAPISIEVASNLELSKFTLVLAVDKINKQLVDIVKLLNEKTSGTLKIALLELARHIADGVEVLVPETYGYEEYVGQLNEYSVRQAWSKEKYSEWLMHHEPQSLDTFENAIEVFAMNGFRWGGTKAATPSGSICVKTSNSERYPLVFHTFGKATVEVRFYDYRNETHAQELLNHFKGLDVIDINSVEAASFSSKPKIPVAKLSDPKILDALVRVCKTVSEN